mgnify:CR=1 FL=1
MAITKRCNDEKIIQWIDNYQSGKSGIYPYQVALQVCAEFVIPIEEAQDYVAEHIKRVLKGVEDEQRSRNVLHT